MMTTRADFFQLTFVAGTLTKCHTSALRSGGLSGMRCHETVV